MTNRILFLLHLPPPVHGSSMVGQYIYRSNIINNAFGTHFVNLGTSKSVDEIGKHPIIKIGRYLNILSEFIRALIKYEPQLVYISITSKGIGFYKDFPIAILAKLFGKKLVLHYHNKGVRSNQHRFIDNIMYRLLFKNTNVILLSKLLYSDVSKYVPEENTFFCPNGIPAIKLEEKIRPKHNNPTRLLFLSNLIESKGVYVLLGALKILNDKGVPFHCNFVGGEGDITIKQLNQKINDFNLQNKVTYLGKKYDEEKYNIYQYSDIFIFPTFYANETFGLVNIEAMMFGLPVISTNEGGIPDIVVDVETGFIVDKQNSEKLAEKIKILIDHPEMRFRMGSAGRVKYEENYTLEHFERRIISILNKIISK